MFRLIRTTFGENICISPSLLDMPNNEKNSTAISNEETNLTKTCFAEKFCMKVLSEGFVRWKSTSEGVI